jgi:hypothetical protein
VREKINQNHKKIADSRENSRFNRSRNACFHSWDICWTYQITSSDADGAESHHPSHSQNSHLKSIFIDIREHLWAAMTFFQLANLHYTLDSTMMIMMVISSHTHR